MKILVLQETDWELRGPHTQHHLMERLSVLGHEIKVIDYEFLWNKSKEKKHIINRTQTFMATNKIIDDASIEVIRPAIIKLPLLSYLSIPFSHTNVIKKLIRDFKPDIIVGFGILNAYIGMKLAKQNNIPFIYFLIDHLHRLLTNKFQSFIAKCFEKKHEPQSSSHYCNTIDIQHFRYVKTK